MDTKKGQLFSDAIESQQVEQAEQKFRDDMMKLQMLTIKRLTEIRDLLEKPKKKSAKIKA